MRSNVLLRSIFKGASVAFAARIVFTAASFALTSLIAQVYGASTVGVVASLTTIMTLGGIVANFGTSSSVNYHVTTQLHTKSVLSARRSFYRIVIICICGSLIVGIGLVALSGPVKRILLSGFETQMPLLLLLIAIAGVPLRLFSELTGLAMRAFEDVPAFAVLIVLPALFNLALLGGGVWMGELPPGNRTVT